MSTKYYPYHVGQMGSIYRPTQANAHGDTEEDFFYSRRGAIDWLRKDFLVCPEQKQYGAAYIMRDVSDNAGSRSVPVAVKRIKFVKKVKPAPKWKAQWLSTSDNKAFPPGTPDYSLQLFDSKEAALTYADRWASRPYWRPGTPKEVK